MKKLLGLLALVFIISSCSVNSTSNLDIEGDDLVYFKDTRSGLCYAATASRKTWQINSTGIALTCVPCDKVKHLIR